MKKIMAIDACLVLLSSLQVFADDSCPQTYEENKCSNFLCTDCDLDSVFKETGLSESQICTAKKLQEKYEQETLSVNDRLLYEENVLDEYKQTCAPNSDIRSQKRKIKDLKKTRKDICKCYEKQFKTMLSDAQKKAYKNAIN